MDKRSNDQIRKNMKAVKSKDSDIERKLCKELWKRGYRYRKNDNSVYGKPDLTFKKQKIAIFCDGEFWHGKDWDIRKKDHKSNINFWHKKIERNIERDRKVNKELVKDGWKVLRFWGQDIINNIETCVNVIENNLKDAYKKNNIEMLK